MPPAYFSSGLAPFLLREELIKHMEAAVDSALALRQPRRV